MNVFPCLIIVSKLYRCKFQHSTCEKYNVTPKNGHLGMWHPTPKTYKHAKIQKQCKAT
jgi:hypothetical protein